MGRGKCSVDSKHQQQRQLHVRLTVDALVFLCSCRWWRHFWLTCSMYLFKHRLISCCCYCCSGFLCMSMSARHVGWKVSRLNEISTLTYMCVCVLASQHVQQFCFYATCVPVVYVPHFICCTFVFRRYMYVIDMFFLLLLTYKQSANKLSHRFLANGASLSTCGNIYWWVFVFCFQLLFMNSILYVYILLYMYAFSRFMYLALGCYA